jgi:hypothetical protein
MPFYWLNEMSIDLPYVGGKFEDLQHLILHLFGVQGFSSKLQGIIYLLNLYVAWGNDKKGAN